MVSSVADQSWRKILLPVPDETMASLLDFHHFFFFRRGKILDFLGLRVSQFFELVERSLLLVLADFLFLLELFYGFLDVPANVADRRAVVLEYLVNVLHHIFT